MKLTRNEKEELVAATIKNLDESKAVILVNYQGLKVNEIQEFKKTLRGQGMGFQIIKNTLFKIALQKEGIEVSPDLLDQPIAVVWSLSDEVIPAKMAVEFKKTAEKLDIIGGIVDQQFAEPAIIKQLATLPSRDELFAKLVGSLNAPMFRLVNVLQGNLRSLVYILKQYQESKI